SVTVRAVIDPYPASPAHLQKTGARARSVLALLLVCGSAGALAGCGGSDNAGGGSVLSSLAGTRTDRVTTGETGSVPTASAPATTSPTTPAETSASPEPPPAVATETNAGSELPATTAAAPAATVTVTRPSEPPSTRPAAT